MPTVLITGANRGLGLEFARQYAGDGWQVIATARDPDAADALRATGAELHQLDVADPAGVDAFAAKLCGRPIDVLIANAGVMGPAQPQPEGWAQTFAVNAIGPTLLARALRENVAASSERKMVAITSQMGSIADNGSGGYIAYRSSKAALNAAWKSLSIDFAADGITVALFHPGWVQTDMGGRGATLPPEESVHGLRRAIGSLDRSRSGHFFNYDGRELPW